LKGRITPFRVGVGLVVAVLLTFLILEKTSSGDYLLLPDIAHPVAPLVHVATGTATGSGELYFVDVQEEQASEFDKLFRGWLHPHSTIEPASDFIPPGSNDHEVQKAELREMASSQQTAAAVALRHLGYPVVIRKNGVLVSQIYLGTGAAGKLQPTDVIVAVNGQPTLTTTALHTLMTKVKPGQTVTVHLLRGTEPLTERIKTVNDHGNALIGFVADQSTEIGKLPLKVAIDSGNIGGPSAGLAFTLEVMRKLGHDVTHGYRVAATGTIEADGTVGPIGGVKQKTWGVREAGAQVFLVPAGGGNAQVAKQNAGPNLKIIPVTSLDQALHALAALPKLPKSS
jgi:PDZ domain-containing protein